jgi:hypothetical protein
MKRALGAVTSWETFQKMTTENAPLASSGGPVTNTPVAVADSDEHRARKNSQLGAYTHPHLDAHK